MTLVTAIKALAASSWLLVIGIFILMSVRSTRQQSNKKMISLLVVVVIAAAALNIVAGGIVFIEPTERGVVITPFDEDGIRPEAIQPGLRLIVPFAENVVKYPISRQSYTMSIAHSEGQIAGDDSVEARTSDGQVVFVDASVIYALDVNKIVLIHIDWQSTYEEGLIRTLSRGIIRDMVSKYGIEEVYSVKREELKTEIRDEITFKLQEEGFVLIDFILRNIAFSPEYAVSVEQKQIAEQQAQQAEFVVETKKQEAEQARQAAEGVADAAVISAEGKALSTVIAATAEAEARMIQAEAEAQALELLGAAIEANPDILTLEYINKLAPNISVMLVPNDNPYILPLPDITEDVIGFE